MTTLTRRQALLVASGGVVAAVTSDARDALAQSGPGRCLLTPQATEGPFYLDPRLERADIVAGRPGIPLLVRFKVAEAGTCAPAARARVDVWQCDAAGVYSGFGGQPGGVDASGQVFLRGHQRTDAAGVTEFRTIWPGWYPGRAPHIHFKVLLGDREALTAQLYFPDALNAKVFAANPAYRRRWAEEARNERDGIFRDVRGAGLASVSEREGTMVATLDVGIARS
jgi:protocatechuate 3,4-dioxygenase beta subunit